MKNKQLLLAAFLCITTIYACEDETGSVSGSPSGNITGQTCDPSKCASGQCASDGKCVPVDGPDGPVVVDPCANGGCPPGATLLLEGAPCIADSKTEICTPPLVCAYGKCMKLSDANLGKPCNAPEDCADQDTFTVCMDNGHCGRVAQIGEQCENIEGGTIACEEGSECMGACIKALREGEACERGDQWRRCNTSDGVFCIDNFCRKNEAYLGLGESCNASYRFCDNKYQCLDDVCKQVVGEEEACDPANNIICPPQSTMRCLGGKCTRTAGECSTSKDCKTSDTYCCTDDSCGAALGTCIPYAGEVTHDESCLFTTKPGVFEAQIQCRWQAPEDGVEPTSNSVEMPPLVGHFMNKLDLPTVVAFYSYATGNQSRTPGSNHKSVIRFIHPETCQTLESISVPLAGRWFDYPAAIDLDDDGMLELLVVLSGGNLAAYKWNGSEHTQIWKANITSGDTIESFDVDLDGKTEIITGTNVVGRDGNVITKGGGSYGRTFALGYMLDKQNQPFAFQTRSDGLYKFDVATKAWIKLATFDGTSSHDNNWTGSGAHTAYADFGTPGTTAADFNFRTLDGRPEFIIAGSGMFKVYSVIPKNDGSDGYSVQTILNIPLLAANDNNSTAAKGGPITVGDFDNDGLPEIGLASTGYFGVYDPLCAGYEEGKCADKYVLWERWSQDASSGTTGSSLFDFDGDGQAEAVYADECFTRIYDGKTGTVLFSSARSSETSIEGPVVADIDNDGSAEILMGSDKAYSCYNDGGAKAMAGIDPIHEGIRCKANEDCPTQNCDKDLGLCICQKEEDCNTQYLDGKLVKQYECTYPIHKDVGFMKNTSGSGRTLAKKRGTRPDGYNTDTGYKVCRAYRNANDATSPGRSDLMILKDRLDRWVSSRNIWNQHAYNIINIEDNGRVPTKETWMNRWHEKLSGKTIEGSSEPRPKYNNYRLNSQGAYGAGKAPDITGKFNAGSVCGTNTDGKYMISAKLCNRGTKPAGKNLPATFYLYDENKPDHRGKFICTSTTKNVFGVGECDAVGCEISEEVLHSLEGQKVLMIANLDENGQASTVECNPDNNTDVIEIDECKADIPVVN